MYSVYSICVSFCICTIAATTTDDAPFGLDQAPVEVALAPKPTVPPRYSCRQTLGAFLAVALLAILALGVGLAVSMGASNDETVSSVYLSQPSNQEVCSKLKGVVTVSGSLTIHTGGPSLTSLACLVSLQVVEGDFRLSYNMAVKEISLHALTRVEGDFILSFNHMLTEISVLALTSVRGDLRISNNNGLVTVSALAMTNVHGHFDIFSNNRLQVEPNELPVLTCVGGAGLSRLQQHTRGEPSLYEAVARQLTRLFLRCHAGLPQSPLPAAARAAW